MVYAVRKKNESADKLINRFKKQVQHSRVLMKVRHGRYHKRQETEMHKKSAAVMREFHRAERKKRMYYDYQHAGPGRKAA